MFRLGKIWCVPYMASFKKLDVVIQREILRRSIGVVAGKLKDVDREHVEMIRKLFDKHVGRRCHLPYQIQAVRTYEGITIKKDTMNEQQLDHVICMDVQAPGIYGIPGTSAEVELFVKENFKNEEIPVNRYTKWFDYDKIENSLSIRTRENGDFITLDGQGHKKLLKRWMIDEKIPREEREQILLLADGRHVLWIMGHRISDNYKVTAATKRVLVARIKGEKSDGRQYQSVIAGGRSGCPDTRTG